MHTRQSALNQWLEQIFDSSSLTLTPLAGDASFRRYFRLYDAARTYIIMDAPPDREAITPFINIGNILTQNGIYTPTIFAVEPKQGFILLEDFGDELLLNELRQGNAHSLYQSAMSNLKNIQNCNVSAHALPLFDEAYMLQELALFKQWFLKAYLSLSLEPKEEELLQNAFMWLTAEILKQPRVFIHKDYHSRNLMVLKKGSNMSLGVIDFQDAMLGPFTYDLVSLLKDCYIQWPYEQVLTWLHHFYLLSPLAQQWTFEEFTRAFNLCGLQRHLKVLGIFSRLHLRDQKPTYLKDLPLTFNYVLACLEFYEELKPLHDFMLQKVQIPFEETIRC